MTDQDFVPVYVYVISRVDGEWPVSPVKVGVTGGLVGRLSSLQTGSHHPLVCVQAFPLPNRDIAFALEKAFHTVLARYRLAGEWFDLDPFEAVGAMTHNIEAMLASHLELEGEELEVALEVSGVHETRKRLAKVRAARDDELIRAMQ